MEELPKAYNPQEVEQKWYKFWEENGLFKPNQKAKLPFTIVIPPPNITGSLHMGHALNNSIQDLLIRYKRMKGFKALWIPGTDHAGIATQNVVERELKKQGIKKEDLGREKFIEKVWEWKNEYGNRITSQLRRLGASCDWSRERFTMDEGLSRAVKRHFVQLYNEGLIYRGKRIINWCPRCQTALSDIEVTYENKKGKLWHIRYGELVVATTRPETMLGDTAVAVNPKDERYKHLWGKTIELPLVGRKIPIIKDDFVDPAFGTGAVKVTPAHDPNDYEMGMRHNLPMINILTPDAKIISELIYLDGLDRYEARKKIVKKLEALGLIEKVEDYENSIGECYRCKTVIEPYLSDQWFVKIKPLAEKAIATVEEGKIKFVPERWTKVYLQWMTNLHDWCISRQLWWGHRIPAWYKNGELYVEEEAPLGDGWVQDADVFDTWFSSALWPFSTLGWPDKTEDLKTFYPTDVLITSYDIIFFWVARMIMAGLHFMNEVPFKTVYFNSLVKDIHGKKMSKSWGNVIDPIDVIEKAGADALRFAFLSLIAGQGQDVKLSEEKITEAKNFANKIWNVARFARMTNDPLDFARGQMSNEIPKNPNLPNKWILSLYNRKITEISEMLDNYQMGEAARDLYSFIWGDFCDWYIELSKSALYGTDEKVKAETQTIMFYVLEGILKLLHPFMPFETEEIYQMLNPKSEIRNPKQMPNPNDSIMVQKWPEADTSLVSEEAEKEMEEIIEIIRAIRNIRATLNIQPKEQVKIYSAKKIDDEKQKYIKTIAKVLEIVISSVHPAHVVPFEAKDIKLGISIEGLIDYAKEAERLKKEHDKLKDEINKVKAHLADENFKKNATEGSIAKENMKLKEYSERVRVLEGYLKVLIA